MATVNVAYDSASDGTDITITLASLGDASYRQSASVDNTTNLFVDAMVGGIITVGTSPTANKHIIVYCYGSVGGTTRFSGAASGSDAAYTDTANQAQNLGFLCTIATDDTSDHGYEFGPFSVARALRVPVLPPYWGVVVYNASGVALNATGSNHVVEYQGIEITSA